jgi:hypothetical protein
VYRLDPLGLVPIEPLFDLIPGLTPFRVTFDCVDGEQITHDYDITEHPVQQNTGEIDVSSNIRKRPKMMVISGTLGAVPPAVARPFVPGLPGPQATPDFTLLGADFFQPSMPPMPSTLVRLDLLRIENLEAMADARRPVMVVTPRATMARCAIANISRGWSPDLGEQTIASITFKEIRIVSAFPAEVPVPDFASQAPGNNATSQGGSSATTVNATVTEGQVAGEAPRVNGVATTANQVPP